MTAVCTVELHVAVNNIKMSSVAQKWVFFWRICVAGNNNKFLELYVEHPIMLFYFTKLGISRQLPESRLTEIRPVGIMLTQKDLRLLINRRARWSWTGCFRNYANAPEISNFIYVLCRKNSSLYFEKRTYQCATGGTIWNQNVGQNTCNLRRLNGAVYCTV